MTWKLVRWIWRLDSPLFIGMPPAGSLNRCRLYVSTRAMHGAVTSELARLREDESSEFPDYGKFGHEIGLNCRFTYLYPAEKIADSYYAWLPEFTQKNGFNWCRQDSGNPISDREFRQRLLGTRPGTAIAPETDSAAEGTLRETECINPRWARQPDGPAVSDQVYLLGYLFLKNNYCNGASKKISGPRAGKKQFRLRDITILYMGGDTRYGFGKICLESWQELSGEQYVFGKPVHLSNNDNPAITSRVVLGHAICDKTMVGGKEQADGWEITKAYKGELAWVPGSVGGCKTTWVIDSYGLWSHENSGN